MNIFDKFLHSISYKFPKGYPDMSNPTDISLLESLISEVLGQSISLNEGSIKQNTVKGKTVKCSHQAEMCFEVL